MTEPKGDKGGKKEFVFYVRRLITSRKIVQIDRQIRQGIFVSALVSSVEGHTERISAGGGNINRGKRRSGAANTGEALQGRLCNPIFVNDMECAGFRDTGSDLLIIRSDLITNRCKYTGDVIKVTDAFGRFKSLKMALVTVRNPAFGTNKVFEVKAEVDRDLQWEALLGNSFYRYCSETADNVEVRVRRVGAVVNAQIVEKQDAAAKNAPKLQFEFRTDGRTVEEIKPGRPASRETRPLSAKVRCKAYQVVQRGR